MEDKTRNLTPTLSFVLSLVTTITLVSPPINQLADYLFTSPESLSSSTNSSSKTSKSNSTNKSNKESKRDITSSKLKGVELYKNLHKVKNKAVGNKVEDFIKHSPKAGTYILGYYIPSGWGPRIAPNGRASSYHRGVDVAMKIGTKLYNPTRYRGRLIYYYDELGGNTCSLDLIDKDNKSVGITLLYLHMSSCIPLTKKNRDGKYEIVEAYGLVGNSGNTGNSTGPHLHFSARLKGVITDAGLVPPSISITEGVISPKDKGL